LIAGGSTPSRTPLASCRLLSLFRSLYILAFPLPVCCFLILDLFSSCIKSQFSAMGYGIVCPSFYQLPRVIDPWLFKAGSRPEDVCPEGFAVIFRASKPPLLGPPFRLSHLAALFPINPPATFGIERYLREVIPRQQIVMFWNHWRSRGFFESFSKRSSPRLVFLVPVEESF